MGGEERRGGRKKTGRKKKGGHVGGGGMRGRRRGRWEALSGARGEVEPAGRPVLGVREGGLEYRASRRRGRRGGKRWRQMLRVKGRHRREAGRVGVGRGGRWSGWRVVHAGKDQSRCMQRPIVVHGCRRAAASVELRGQVGSRALEEKMQVALGGGGDGEATRAHAQINTESEELDVVTA